ncbi:26S proteasome non-ATPase regulatory subunit 1, partial [Trachymyrmex cornetzi]
GSCFGLGLAAMSSHRQDVYKQLRSNLCQNDSVTAEAAGIAMEMVILRSKSTHVIEDKFNAHFSQHYSSRNFLYINMKNF